MTTQIVTHFPFPHFSIATKSDRYGAFPIKIGLTKPKHGRNNMASRLPPRIVRKFV